jgi:DNA-binding TFAR19-related protein (PDSD5 family)
MNYTFLVCLIKVLSSAGGTFMKKLFDKSIKIFSMYSRLIEFRNSKNYSNILKTQLDNTVLNILYNIALQRKELYKTICPTENEKFDVINYFERGDISYFLKKYEIKLLQLIHKREELDDAHVILILNHLKKEKQSLNEIVKSFLDIDITIPHSWNACVKKSRLALFRA